MGESPELPGMFIGFHRVLFIPEWLQVFLKGIPVALSEENRKLTASYYKLNLETVEMIYNPVITRRYYHKENPERKFTYITVGRLSPEKNQIMLLTAFEKATECGMDARLVIVGDGSDRNMLELYAQEHNIEDRVDFTGFVDNVQDYLAEADVYLLSSKVEGVSLSILEAMASSLPVITTDVGGCRDIVTDNGILVELEDLRSYTEAILKVYTDQNFRIRLGEKSRKNVQPFDISNIAKAYMELYSKYENN